MKTKLFLVVAIVLSIFLPSCGSMPQQQQRMMAGPQPNCAAPQRHGNRPSKHQGYLVQEKDRATGQPIGEPFWVSGEVGDTYNGKEFRKHEDMREVVSDQYLNDMIQKLRSIPPPGRQTNHP